MRKVALLGTLVLALMGTTAGNAGAAEEFDKFDLETVFSDLSSRQAGAHADMTVGFKLTNDGTIPFALMKNVEIKLPPGMAGNPEAVRQCTPDQLGDGPANSHCPFDSQVGMTEIRTAPPHPGVFNEPVYNMVTPKGFVARLGFMAVGWPAFINVRLDPTDHSIVSTVEGVPSIAGLSESTTTLWGVPAAHEHDPDRVTPLEVNNGEAPAIPREVNSPEIPFLTNPTDCSEQRQVRITASSYQEPDRLSTKFAPFPPITGCGLLDFNPTTTLKPTTAQGTSGSGLDYELSLPADGLQEPDLLYGSELRRAEVVLPEGMTINPSQAEGIGVCSEADYARETYDSGPNAGCPETAKVGSVEAVTPVLGEKAEGALFLAKPYENPFGSLIALYMVLKIPDRGVLVKMAGRVTTDPATGQITTVFDDAPQLPVSNFKLHFREGARAPLVTPAACGTYTAFSNMTPWSKPGFILPRPNAFAIESGPDHGPCPSGGLPPFHPGLTAYSTNQAAGAFTPFNVHLTRTDAEQEITNFSIKLPPGLVGKLAGIPFCSDAAIAEAKARTGIHGGEEEINAPTCPAASQIGSTWAGAGVGQVLVYVPGKIYLAGPYHGSPLSIVAVTAAKAGPFDLGTVVVREALKIDPDTAEVSVDAAGSDPLPHIIAGIPVRLRDIRAYVDRPDFVLNPTDCSRTSTASTLRGAGLDFTSEADNNPVTVTSPFQAADCAALGFKPKLDIKLKGGTKRNANPALTAVVRARPGDANIDAAQVTLPHSAFLDQSHIQTVCTRVQFNSGVGNGANCPAGSVYGKARAITPLLDEPLSGPVYLRSSSHPLPDMVVALHSGKIDINLVGRIDTGKGGGIRSSFESVPDAPITSFTLEMAGGKKGLIVNSTNLCAGKNRAVAEFTGQNGKARNFRPLVKPTNCKGKARRGANKVKRAR